MYLDIDGQDEQKTLELILDNTPVLIAYMDNDFNFIRVNKAYAEADEKKISFFPGKNHFDLYPNEENEKIFQKVIDSGEPVFIRGKPFEYADNPERGVSYWDWSLIPLKDSNDNVKSLLLTLRNVTEREKVKKSLEESRDRINFYKDLLAHDMRNILSVILASIDLIKNRQDDQLKSDFMNLMIKRIIEQVQKGAFLISAVQKFSEITTIEKTIKSVQLKKIIDNVISQIKSRFNGKNISIETDFPEESIKVRGGNLLYDAFENLLINGIVHNNSQEKHIWIDISKSSDKGTDFIKLEFKDNGMGIPDKNINIFKKGYKREDSKGMGLGLTLVKAIIEGYKGKIWIEDRIMGDYTKGSNFIIQLREG